MKKWKKKKQTKKHEVEHKALLADLPLALLWKCREANGRTRRQLLRRHLLPRVGSWAVELQGIFLSIEKKKKIK